MSKIKNANYILIVVILIFIITGGILSYFLSKKEPVPISKKEGIEKEEVQKKEDEDTIISTPPEEVWKTYTSVELGFSIKYPEMVYGVCKCSPRKSFYVPLKIFEDNENGIVYITEEYYYKAKYDSELNEYTGPCEKIMNSLELLQKEKEKIQKGEFSLWWKPFLGWAVLTGNIKNENELNKFIKDNYGSECFVKDKKLWGRDGIYEINIEGKDYTEGINPNCPLNYVYKILYAPEKNKAMSVKLGQECGFGTDYNSKDYKCYDGEMIDSFRFIDQIENNGITYKTFSSPKADFEFEYPDTWVYDEEKDPYDSNTTNWGFYLNPEKKPEDLILAAISPLSEIVDFCSSGTKESIYQLNTFPTNNPETYITYEQCGREYGSAYIYWQKGKYFANAGNIKDYREINLMIFYSGTENKENMSIIRHIAQSIKIK